MKLKLRAQFEGNWFINVVYKEIHIVSLHFTPILRITKIEPVGLKLGKLPNVKTVKQCYSTVYCTFP